MSTKDIVIPQEELQTAVTQLRRLSEQMTALKETVSNMLVDMKHGFNTPAGRQFISSCTDNVLAPLKQQAAVIQHLSDTLATVNRDYEPVFTEYSQLNNAINNVKSGS